MTDVPQEVREQQIGGAAELLIFVRADGFYPVQGVANRCLRAQAEEHATLNPGTLRVEDVDGNVLWRLH